MNNLVKINQKEYDIDKLINKIDCDIQKYADTNLKPCKWDKDGNILEKEVDANPLVLSNMFLKPLFSAYDKEPNYNSIELSYVFELYCHIISQINSKISEFPPSLSSFCKFASITLNTLRRYKKSEILELRIVAEKIYDEIGDNNLSMAQLGMVKGTPTQFKMKTQNEMVEKQQPNVNITYKEVINTDKLNQNLEKYKALLGD